MATVDIGERRATGFPIKHEPIGGGSSYARAGRTRRPPRQTSLALSHASGNVAPISEGRSSGSQ
jgi:hypothetical protein